MKKIITVVFWYYFTQLEFIIAIFHEFGLWIFGKKKSNTVNHNISWIEFGFKEYSRNFNILYKIPMEWSMSYINHLHKNVYRK